MFITEESIHGGTWQSFERLVQRLLLHSGFENIRLVSAPGDHGADILASKNKKRWLFQVKNWEKKVGIDVVAEVLRSCKEYEADIPVIVSKKGFDATVQSSIETYHRNGIYLQLWDSNTLINRAKAVENRVLNTRSPRKYQEEAIKSILDAYLHEPKRNSLIVLATGLGKTFVCAESLRRILINKKQRVLVLAHTNPLVYQLERSFWPFLLPEFSTVVWNGNEKPSQSVLEKSTFVFACIDSVSISLKTHHELPEFDIIIVDECHHAGSKSYQSVLDLFGSGTNGGCFTIGLTATPWRTDDVEITKYFGEPRIQIDMIQGIQNGFLAQVDYRMHVDNINWDIMYTPDGLQYSPRQLNRTLFINQWDDAVVNELKNIWHLNHEPKAIVFCGTIEHTIIMRDKINRLDFAHAEAIYSQSSSTIPQQSVFQRNKILADFSDNKIGVICTVDILNEGIDVPDVNIIVFQRVTHSRRIFIQQLGRGLRLSDQKSKVIVLDFVSDVRRLAAGARMKDDLAQGTRIDYPSNISFRRIGSEDSQTELFIRDWLDKVGSLEQIEEMSDDTTRLRIPTRTR
jgi:superfamily II DNA or RNA helicase